MLYPATRLTVGVPDFFVVVEAYLGSRTVQGRCAGPPVPALRVCSPCRALGA